jgi:hypothetical protein
MVLVKVVVLENLHRGDILAHVLALDDHNLED